MRLSTILYLCLLTFTVFYGFYHFKKLSITFKILVFLITLTIIQTIIAQVLIRTIYTSYPTFHIYTVIGLIFQLFIYQSILVFSKINYLILLSLTALFIGLTVYNTCAVQSLDEFPSHGIMLHAIQAIIFALVVYFNMLNHPSEISIYKQSIFWLNTGNFVFYGITFSIFALYSFYIKTSSVSSWGSSLIYYANIFLYSSYLYAIILDSKQKNGRNSFG